MCSLMVVNDIVGIGKVATTATLPIFSCLNIETIVLPTVLLNSHTGGFSHIEKTNYQPGFEKSLEQWKHLSLSLSGIVTGYFLDKQQIHQLLDFYHFYRKKQSLPLIVDPVLGDNGVLYQGLTTEHIEAMKHLVSFANCILPNWTEACLLSQIPYKNELSHIDEAKEIIEALVHKDLHHILITSVTINHQTGVLHYFHKNKSYTFYPYQKIEGHFFGSGDIFTALITTAQLKNIPLSTAIPNSLKWLKKCLLLTDREKRDRRFGIHYEPLLMELMKDFKKMKEREYETND